MTTRDPLRRDPFAVRELPLQPPTGTGFDFDEALEGSFGENRRLRESVEQPTPPER